MIKYYKNNRKSQIFRFSIPSNILIFHKRYTFDNGTDFFPESECQHQIMFAFIKNTFYRCISSINYDSTIIIIIKRVKVCFLLKIVQDICTGTVSITKISEFFPTTPLKNDAILLCTHNFSFSHYLVNFSS